MTEGGLYLNVDRAMAVFTEGGKLTELIRRIVGDGRLGPRELRTIEEQIKTLKFNALHLSYKRTFIIAGLSKDSVKNTFFNQNVNGQEKKVSVYDYFQKEYSTFCQRYKLDPNMPCVQVGSRKMAKYFPIECVELEYDEVYRRKLNPMLQGMVTRKSSQQTPFDRFLGLSRHISTIESDNIIDRVNYLQNFGINIAKNKTQIKARILDAPQLAYGQGMSLDTRNMGQWDMKNYTFLEPSDIGNNWAVFNSKCIENERILSFDH